MTHRLSIRRVKPDELDELVEVYLRAYRGLEEYAERTPEDAGDYLEWLYGTCPEGFFVAEVDGRKVGFVACNPHWKGGHGDSTCEIHEIAVLPEWQGMGIGRRLMEKALELGRRHGCPTATLWVGRGNERALSWYRKMGFEPVGSWGRWIRMRRPLTVRAGTPEAGRR